MLHVTLFAIFEQIVIGGVGRIRYLCGEFSNKNGGNLFFKVR